MAGERGIIGSVLRDIGTGIVDFAKTKEATNAATRRDAILEQRQLNLLRMQQQFQTQTAEDTRTQQTEERIAGEEFRGGQQTERLKSQEEIAGAKATTLAALNLKKEETRLSEKEESLIRSRKLAAARIIDNLTEAKGARRSFKTPEDILNLRELADKLIDDGVVSDGAEAVKQARKDITFKPALDRTAKEAKLKPVAPTKRKVKPTLKERREARRQRSGRSGRSVPKTPPKKQVTQKVSRKDLDDAIAESGMPEAALKRALTLDAQAKGITLQFP